MGGRLDPAVASARLSLRASLAALPGPADGDGGLVLVGLSGGADSLALAVTTAFVAPRERLRWGVVIVDHALQQGSDAIAATAARQAERLGADPVRLVRVDVGVPCGHGPEAAARTARYAVLDQAASELGAAAVLLAHTRDDQAETVLLGLARGSGARSLAGMRPRVDQPAGQLLRPFLDLTRADTLAVCAAAGVAPWSDPHNQDPAYLRSRVRTTVLPVLEQHLGPGVSEALSRTATLLRDDADLLDTLAAELFDEASTSVPGDACVVLPISALSTAPPALRRRLLRLAALAAGAPGNDLAATHVDAVDRLTTHWRGQRGIDLPGRVQVRRVDATLHFTGPAVGR
ncbi:MAG: tRNA lysidine(34) synthetase TilS [Nocardioidaceae bacterium]|nr:tRNA lysidine(34) synthetase TilS [Nocardioidaceae bacterium]